MKIAFVGMKSDVVEETLRLLRPDAEVVKDDDIRRYIVDTLPELSPIAPRFLFIDEGVLARENRENVVGVLERMCATITVVCTSSSEPQQNDPRRRPVCRYESFDEDFRALVRASAAGEREAAASTTAAKKKTARRPRKTKRS